MPVNTISIDRQPLAFSDISSFIDQHLPVHLGTKAADAILHCRQYLDQKMEDNHHLFYGINTGFGFLQNVRIDDSQLEALQANLLKSHACGLGEEVPHEIVRLMLLLKIAGLSAGYSGVQLSTVNRLVDMLNHDVLPVIYTQGSLGASGDLAPLSHLSLPLLGLGEVFYEGKKYPSQVVLDMLDWEPVPLKSKEGLALINGTQFMSAYGLYILHASQRLLNWANLIGSVSFDAFDCVPDPLHEKIHALRPHHGQVQVAKTLRSYLDGSTIVTQKKSQVQDPYSFRCIPQVHGATADVLTHARDVFVREINGVTDNPNIFPDEDLILSGGNFHGQPLALQLDFLAIAMSELGSISERRTYQLISGQRGLPAFLVKDPGLHSGFMIPQYTAAGIVSENKQLCTPASVDSIPSSNNQEDHVSMGANAATKCLRVIHNVERVLAIELLTAAQALEFRRPLKTGTAGEDMIAAFRKEISFNEADRVMHDDLKLAIEFLQTYPIINQA